MLFGGNVIKILHKYHETFVDRVFNHRFYTDKGVEFDADPGDNRFSPDLFVAYMTAK